MTRSRSVVWRGVSAFLALTLVLLAASCSSSGANGGTQAPAASPTAWLMPTAKPSPTAIPIPTPTPEPLGPTGGELMGACSNFPVALAAPYDKGTYHPLVVVDNSVPTYPDLSTEYATNSQWRDGTWTSPIQLVICVGADKPVRLANCGQYIRRSDGKRGFTYTWRHARTLTVIVAATGKKLTAKTLYGTAPGCKEVVSVPSDSNPPWARYGSEVSAASIDNYAGAISRQLVK